MKKFAEIIHKKRIKHFHYCIIQFENNYHYQLALGINPSYLYPDFFNGKNKPLDLKTVRKTLADIIKEYRTN